MYSNLRRRVGLQLDVDYMFSVFSSYLKGTFQLI